MVAKKTTKRKPRRAASKKAAAKKPPRKKPGPAKGSGGRPRKLTVDDKMIRQVETMAGLGMKFEEICLILGVSETTLRQYRRRYPELSAAYQKGRTDGINDAADDLRRLRKKGNAAAIIFYLKTQGRWSEKHIHEHTGKDGKPIETKTTIDLSLLSDEQLRQLKELIKIAESKAAKPQGD